MGQIRASLVLLSLIGLYSDAHAALLSRQSGQAYFDTSLGITWLADAGLAAGTAFGVTGIGASGAMTWAKAQEWIAALNAARYLGHADWHLPTALDIDGPDPDRLGNDGCTFSLADTDCGYNVNLATGQLAHLYYETLLNKGYFTTSGVYTGCHVAPNYCLKNPAPFAGTGPYRYWYGTTLATDPTQAWTFNFQNGNQQTDPKTMTAYAWAVRTGDTPVVPLPAAALLYLSGLAVLGGASRLIHCSLSGVNRGNHRPAAPVGA